jgi:hypothetical protein
MFYQKEKPHIKKQINQNSYMQCGKKVEKIKRNQIGQVMEQDQDQQTDQENGKGEEHDQITLW